MALKKRNLEMERGLWDQDQSQQSGSPTSRPPLPPPAPPPPQGSPGPSVLRVTLGAGPRASTTGPGLGGGLTARSPGWDGMGAEARTQGRQAATW